MLFLMASQSTPASAASWILFFSCAESNNSIELECVFAAAGRANMCMNWNRILTSPLKLVACQQHSFKSMLYWKCVYFSNELMIFFERNGGWVVVIFEGWDHIHWRPRDLLGKVLRPGIEFRVKKIIKATRFSGNILAIRSCAVAMQEGF